MRSSVSRAFLALPFQMRQCNRSTSATIAVFAWMRPGSSVDNPLAACFACCRRMAMWNQSAIGGFVTPASASNDRRPGQPSVNAVNVVAAVRPTVSRLRRSSTAISVPAFATAPKTCRLPSDVSTLPTRTSKCRSPSWQLRMKVESRVTVMLAAAAAGLTAGERHLEVRVGNVETSDGSRQVFGAVAKADTDVAVLLRRSLETVGRTAATALTAFTDGCPGLRSILAEAGVTKPPIADWFHIAMRLQ